MIWSSKYWVTGDNCLELADCIGAFWGPHKGHILLGKVLDRADYLGITADKGVVVTEQS